MVDLKKILKGSATMIRVTVWNEFRHELKEEKIREVYPKGIHEAIADFLGKEEDIEVKTVYLDMPDCGITDELLDNTDVLMWWGHIHHNEVPDEIAFKVQRAVLKGMGFIALHSAHHSKPFRFLMGTSGNLSWREDGDLERVWFVDPSHPIVQGVGNGRYFELPHEEMYGEPFSIPEPDKLILMGWYEGGEVFRSGCLYQKEYGKVFYFQPGHESYPTFYNKDVQKILLNAVRYVNPTYRVQSLDCPHVELINK